MRANMTLLCGYLAWPTHPGGTKHQIKPGGPAVIPTAATVEVADYALHCDTQRWVSVVRYKGRFYTVPSSLLATPAEAFKSLKKGK